jgi:hypothetical protein
VRARLREDPNAWQEDGLDIRRADKRETYLLMAMMEGELVVVREVTVTISSSVQFQLQKRVAVCSAHPDVIVVNYIGPSMPR